MLSLYIPEEEGDPEIEQGGNMAVWRLTLYRDPDHIEKGRTCEAR
jgi:hypothetical protein